MFLRGVFWDSLGRFLIHSIGIIFTIFLARILTPGDYGLVAIALAIVVICESLLDSGFSSALIQKKRITRVDYCSVFYVQLALSLVLFLGVWWLSAPLARLFGYKELGSILSVVAISVPLVGLVSVIRARLIRSVNFRQMAMVDVVATITGGSLALVMAINGFEYWSLVAQILTAKLVCAFLFWARFPLKLSYGISTISLRNMANFGVYSSFTSILRNVSSQFDSFIIAKLFMPEVLGLYTKAKSIRDLIIIYAGGSVGRVFFPVVSRLKSEQLESTYLATLEAVAIASLLLSGVVFVSTEELVLLLFGDQWLGAIMMIQFLVIADGVTKPLGSVMLSALAGVGAVRLEFFMVLLKRAVWLCCLVLLWLYGIKAYLWSLIAHAMFVYFVDAMSIYYSKKISLLRQLLLPLFGYLVFALTVYSISLIAIPTVSPFFSLFLKSCLFIAIFLVLSFPFYKSLYLGLMKKVGEITLG